MAKTVKIDARYQVLAADGSQCATKKTADSLSVQENSAHFPQKIAGAVIDLPIQFGGVANAKRVFIRTNAEVTLKINDVTDTGFPFGPGDGYLMSQTGITSMFVSTGPSETEFEAILSGD